MRKQIWVSVLFISSLLCYLSCKKEQPTNLPPPEFQNLSNTPPKAYAGPDIWVILPTTSCKLKASAIDAENNVSHYVWKKVDGPSSYDIKSANAHETEVTKLEKGSYAFEVLVTDKGGLSSKDTVMVYVREPAAPGQGEAILKDLKWSCPWECAIMVDCFSCIVPANRLFKVFLKRDFTNQWFEVLPDTVIASNTKYVYTITDNILWVYSLDYNGSESDTPDVMITF